MKEQTVDHSTSAVETSSRIGHLPTVVASFLHFDLSFMLWVMIGALGAFISRDLHLQPAQKGLLVAMPILSGSLMRFPIGYLADRVGGKKIAMGMLMFYFMPLFLVWKVTYSFSGLLCSGLLLGIAGASFAVALPLASKWYPANRQGLVMGIAAAGNSGTVLANLFCPRLAAWLGWRNVFGLAMLPLFCTLLAFFLLAKESPRSTAASEATDEASPLFSVLRVADLWRFCFFYAVTFGGYVGLSSFLPIFFRDQFGITAVQAGSLTAMAAFLGSGARPLGGFLADKLGGVRLLSVLFLAICAVYASVSMVSTLTLAAALVWCGMFALGMGNGAVFQLVPQRFSKEIGVATGVVGAIGGVGGFLLPTLLGSVKQTTGSFRIGFIILATVAASAALFIRLLASIRQEWRLSWKLALPQVSGLQES